MSEISALIRCELESDGFSEKLIDLFKKEEAISCVREPDFHTHDNGSCVVYFFWDVSIEIEGEYINFLDLLNCSSISGIKDVYACYYFDGSILGHYFNTSGSIYEAESDDGDLFEENNLDPYYDEEDEDFDETKQMIELLDFVRKHDIKK